MDRCGSRSWITRSATSTPAVSARLSSSRGEPRRVAWLPLSLFADVDQDRPPVLGVDLARARACCANSRSSAADELAEVGLRLSPWNGPADFVSVLAGRAAPAGRHVVRPGAASAARPPGKARWRRPRSRRSRVRSVRSSRVSASPNRCVCTRRSARKRPSAARRRPMSGKQQARGRSDHDVVDLARAVNESADLSPALPGRFGERTRELRRHDAIEGHSSSVDALESSESARRQTRGVAVDFVHPLATQATYLET